VRGQKGVAAEEADGLEKHDADGTVSVPQCDGVGDCCVNHAVVLDPADLQRILYNKNVQKNFSIRVTSDLYRGTERPLLSYWIDKASGVPMCVVRRDKKEDGNEECAFLVTGESRDRYCLLGDDKPTACKTNPVRRIASKDMLGRMEGWKYVVNDIPCQICDKCDDDKRIDVKIEDHLVEQGMEERYAMTDLFHGFAGWLVKEIKAEEMQKLAAMIVFDFDSYSVDVGGMTIEQAQECRPASPENAILSAKQMVGMIVFPERFIPKEGADDTGGDTDKKPSVESGD